MGCPGRAFPDCLADLLLPTARTAVRLRLDHWSTGPLVCAARRPPPPHRQRPTLEAETSQRELLVFPTTSA
jgi:hypothetical protein